MRRFIVTEAQLKEYVDTKNSEKVFYNIVEELHKTKKFLNENVSQKNVNQSVIEKYRMRKTITPKVFEMLIKHKIINEDYEII